MIEITKDIKQEILNAIHTISLVNYEFDHQLEDCSTTYDTLKREVESENFNIEVEFTEEVKWSSYDFYETENIEISSLYVYNENGEEIDTSSISDSELEDYINY